MITGMSMILRSIRATVRLGDSESIVTDPSRDSKSLPPPPGPGMIMPPAVGSIFLAEATFESAWPADRRDGAAPSPAARESLTGTDSA